MSLWTVSSCPPLLPPVASFQKRRSMSLMSLFCTVSENHAINCHQGLISSEAYDSDGSDNLEPVLRFPFLGQSEGSPDIHLPSTIFQLLLGDPKVFSYYMR